MKRSRKSTLKETHERLISILENMADAFVSLDRDWRYTYMNRRAGEISGRNPQEMIGKHIWTEFPEGIGQPFHLAYERAMREQCFISLEKYYPRMTNGSRTAFILRKRALQFSSATLQPARRPSRI